MIVSVHQPQYLPYLGFFHKLAHSDIYIVLDNVQFLRRGFQHRAQIKTPQGSQWLTVPVEAGSDTEIRAVAISPTEPWQRRHVNAVKTNYGSAPFFDRYMSGFTEIIERPWRNVSDLDIALIRWVMEELGISTSIVHASNLKASGSSSELLASLCAAVGATTYLSGPGGARYMDLSVFERAGLAVSWQRFDAPIYQQLFPRNGFIPDLSILDVLLCCGPDAKSFLEGPP